ncbi:MAG TPA: ABC transporter substrate-binding protein [Candidatus Limnocylindrales bacterium]
MRRVDRVFVTGLTAALAILALSIGQPAPAVAPVASPANPDPVDSPSPSAAAAPAVYREGIVGRAKSITPLTAQTAADRELVALVFSGLVRLGPGGTLLPDLAQRWSVADDGATWTFELRPDASWQDGAPVTSADVVFTMTALKDPAYPGPDGTSWREVSVTAVDDHTVRFKLETPLGGFLQALTQPLLPEHLLAGVPVDALADHPFGQAPVGSGPFRLVEIDASEADLVPAGTTTPRPTQATGGPDDASPGPSSGAGTASPAARSTTAPGALAGAAATPSAGTSQGRLDRIELHFFADEDALVAAYTAGDIDAAVGLTAARAAALGSQPGSQLLRYPLSTVTAIVLNQRVGYPYREAVLRRVLLQTIDREALATKVVAGLASRAETPIPPASWAFDATASQPTAVDRSAAAAALRKAGWQKASGLWRPKGAKSPAVLRVISLDDTNSIVRATADQVVRYWTTFGFKVTFEALAPADFATRLQDGEFSVAVVDVNVGLDPDLYPLFASTQATARRSNISGIQNRTLDARLAAARKPGSDAARRKAYEQLQAYLADALPMLPLFFRDEPVVVANRVVGPAIHQLGGPGDRFWDVLTWRLAIGQ